MPTGIETIDDGSGDLTPAPVRPVQLVTASDGTQVAVRVLALEIDPRSDAYAGGFDLGREGDVPAIDALRTSGSGMSKDQYNNYAGYLAGKAARAAYREGLLAGGVGGALGGFVLARAMYRKKGRRRG